MQTISLPCLRAEGIRWRHLVLSPHTYQSYRYVLGGWASTRWCASASIPVPPSPVLDPTLKKCGAAGRASGFDSWIMFNVYPSAPPTPAIWIRPRPRPVR